MEGIVEVRTMSRQYFSCLKESAFHRVSLLLYAGSADSLGVGLEIRRRHAAALPGKQLLAQMAMCACEEFVNC